MTVPDRLSAALADRYALERELGQGDMATVSLTEDLKHRRKVGNRRGLVASDPFAPSFDVDPNGDMLMLRSRPGGGATELTMIEDWRTALERH